MVAGWADRHRTSRSQLDRRERCRRSADQLLHHRHSGCRPRSSPVPDDDQILTAYNRLPETYGRNQYVLTNSGEQAATVFGLKMWAEGSTDKLAVLFAATASAANGSAASRGYGPLENDQDIVGELLTDPNAATFARGRLFSDRAFTIKWTTTYRFPKGIQLGVIARYQDGQPFARLVAVPGLNQGTELIRAYPNAGNRFTFTGTLDVRVQKIFDGRTAARCRRSWTSTIWRRAPTKWRNTRSPVRTSGRPRRSSRLVQSISVSVSCCSRSDLHAALGHACRGGCCARLGACARVADRCDWIGVPIEGPVLDRLRDRTIDRSTDESKMFQPTAIDCCGFFARTSIPLAHTVTTSLFGLRARTAIYRPGSAPLCVLAGRSADLQARACATAEPRAGCSYAHGSSSKVQRPATARTSVRTRRRRRIHRTKSQTPTQNARDRRLARWRDHRRTIRAWVRRTHAACRVVDGQERSERAGRHSRWRTTFVAAGQCAPAGVATA